MVRADVVYLIGEVPEAHGVFDLPAETKRMVYCTVRSVSRSEVYAAKSSGLDPQLVFVLSDYLEYDGEPQLEYQGRRYKVIRTYVNNQQIEITVERG